MSRIKKFVTSACGITGVAFLLVGCTSEKAYLLDLEKDQPSHIEVLKTDNDAEYGCSFFPMTLIEQNLQLAIDGGEVNESELVAVDDPDAIPARFKIQDETLILVDYDIDFTEAVGLTGNQFVSLSEDSSTLVFTNISQGYACFYPLAES